MPGRAGGILAVGFVAAVAASVAAPAEVTAPAAAVAVPALGAGADVAPAPAPPDSEPVRAWIRTGDGRLAAFEETVREINAVWESDAPGDGSRRVALFVRLRSLVTELRAVPVPEAASATAAAAWRETVSALDEGVTHYERWQARSARYNVRSDDLLTRATARLRAGLVSGIEWRRLVGAP